ncbi:sterol esterase tgl1 [Anaeramoeba flamelloides]|uniref:Sterol esterase tgl1 n=1 Tax=Anaeramoeba flamelloides TaxID=1746091 RepID=A0AAV8A1I6_9EUKA|nr:sterol esterase tgl1 [Anaeramoeba flamelloides]
MSDLKTKKMHKTIQKIQNTHAFLLKSWLAFKLFKALALVIRLVISFLMIPLYNTHHFFTFLLKTKRNVSGFLNEILQTLSNIFLETPLFIEDSLARKNRRKREREKEKRYRSGFNSDGVKQKTKFKVPRSLSLSRSLTTVLRKQTKRIPSSWVDDLILSHGFMFEEHLVETQDGFLLKLFRLIPKRKEKEKEKENENGNGNGNGNGNEQRPVVFFQHGIMSSASFFLIGDSLPYQLIEMGYDCWFGNTRGNFYSDKHRSLSSNDPEYWDHTFNELVEQDLPAMVNFVLEKTKQETFTYIAFSQGTAQGFAAFSEYPDLCKKCNLFVAFAPTAHLKFIDTFFLKLAVSLPTKYAQLILGHDAIFRTVYPVARSVLGFKGYCLTMKYCMHFLFGWHNRNLNKKWMPYFAQTLYSTMSTKIVVYWFQQLRKQSFDKYDYEDENVNLKKYGQKTPPEYQLSKINCPMALFSGSSDNLSNVNVVVKEKLNPKYVLEDVRLPDFEHLDSVWGRDLDLLVFPKVFKLLKKYNPAN